MRTFERVINSSMGGEGSNLWMREFGGGVETLGGLAYITEALLQSHEGFLRFFPGVPPREGASFAGLRARGGLVVNATLAEDGSVHGVRVLSEQGQNISVLSPGGGHVSVVDIATSGVVSTTSRKVREAWVREFSTRRGGAYELAFA